MVRYIAKPCLSQHIINLGIVGTSVNNYYYSQVNFVVKGFLTYLCLKDYFRSYLKSSRLMEGKFKDQGHLYQDSEECLSSRGSQPDSGLFFLEEKH